MRGQYAATRTLTTKKTAIGARIKDRRRQAASSRYRACSAMLTFTWVPASVNCRHWNAAGGVDPTPRAVGTTRAVHYLVQNLGTHNAHPRVW